ncbi:LysR family transcriptional regulator [Pigmentiphaga litoralis]|uniref:DNA-binding transcriptional LysR family regulator n=1 Tax=Pigmentiphaga litoralis TaxID=516702 RepID=A0A7Y9LPC9_9BURK|nr:LysR family transcriptional regulator [Pigmentiphaga litoralis]NYE26773.1 DNA-binding transcriptional LysR family regulator [Pigmentiphaga litoralis]NYE85817.1 DNA-binding transcriptional LysR family regulator [Pigmentiphaga litoralis]
MDRWREMELFVQIAEQGSLTRAAEAVGLSNAAASRHLSTLEQRVAARLVERNTRRLYLTEVGEAFYQRCKSILADMQDAESMANATAVNPTGDLRITASVSFAMRHIAPILPAFTQRYPQVNVHLMTSNRYYDLIENGIDLAIRTREVESDSTLTIRRLAETRRVLAASPRYLDQYGTPQTVQDLSRHRLLLYTYANRYDELRFTRRGNTVGSTPANARTAAAAASALASAPASSATSDAASTVASITESITVKGLLESNEGQVLVAAALDGLGILVQPKYIIYDEIVAGRLVPVLDDWDLPRLSINLAYPNRQYLPAKTRCFIDFLAAHFDAMEFGRKWST